MSSGFDRDPLFARILNFVFPWLCFGCGQEVATPGLCGACWMKVTRIVAPLCSLCGRPVCHDLEGKACVRCYENVPHWVSHRSLWGYGALSRRILFSLKYGRRAYLASHLAHWMIPQVMDRSFAWVVPVPLHARRLKKRGFNQAALLAKCLAKLLGLPFDGQALARISDAGSQAGQSYRGRHENVMGAFVPRRQWQGESILLVDDVFTTGATLNACTLALLEGGAGQVHGQTVAQVI